MRRYGIRDDQWERIRDLLPGQEGHVGVTAADNRLFVEAVLYRYRAGISLAAARAVRGLEASAYAS
jgi:transposase